MRILTIVGARPQFIKAAAISRRLRDLHFCRLDEAILHTGQHYDPSMSGGFFSELEIPAPRWNLGAGGGGHGAQTGAMISGIEQVLADWKPALVLVYGDTNSTLAGALAAAKAGIDLAHVEAGLRSFRRGMPEEVNRVVTDRLAQHLFCPTPTAVDNLIAEGRREGVCLVGDVMFDTFLHASARSDLNAPSRHGLSRSEYALATLHRAENTDDPSRLSCLFDALGRVARVLPVFMPLHPRTRKAIQQVGIIPAAGIYLAEPQPYGELVSLMLGARAVATDSGGMQKEAFFAAVPCVTLRDETEWVETVEAGWNTLAPPSAAQTAPANIAEAILQAAQRDRTEKPPQIYGDGDAAGRILEHILRLI